MYMTIVRALIAPMHGDTTAEIGIMPARWIAPYQAERVGAERVAAECLHT